MPLSVVEFRAACCADKHVLLTDLHQRDAVFQGQDKPVLSVFGVPVEDDPFWVKRPQLKGRLDAAEIQQSRTELNSMEGDNCPEARAAAEGPCPLTAP